MTKRIHKLSRGELPNFPGQHFMHNKRLINEIVDLGKVNKQDLVLDLGAGKGALTAVLAKKARKVVAVEYDDKLVDILLKKFGDASNVNIVHRDMLTISLPKEPFIVISNIPYAITTPILKKLLSNPTTNFQRAVIVMEKGAAKRFTSSNVKDPYVIGWRMFFDIRYVKRISRKNFSPPPKVDSAMITIHRKENPLVPYESYLRFLSLAEYLLKNPRAPIDLALRGIFTAQQIKRLKRSIRVNSDIPVATLSEEQWAIVFDTMVKYVPTYRWPRVKKRMRK